MIFKLQHSPQCIRAWDIINTSLNSNWPLYCLTKRVNQLNCFSQPIPLHMHPSLSQCPKHKGFACIGQNLNNVGNLTQLIIVYISITSSLHTGGINYNSIFVTSPEKSVVSYLNISRHLLPTSMNPKMSSFNIASLDIL